VYVILAMPFAYRSLDAGLRSLELRTLVDAASSLGARWPTTLWRGLLPNPRPAPPAPTGPPGPPLLRAVHLGQPRPVPDVPGMDRGLRPDQRAGLDRRLAAGAARDLGVPDADRHTGQPAVAPHRHRPGRVVLGPADRPVRQGEIVEATNTTSGTAAGITSRAASGGAPVTMQKVSRTFGTVRALNGLSL